jgi:TetR/AcrR family transcriptional regulator, tetracycline repressor protein
MGNMPSLLSGSRKTCPAMMPPYEVDGLSMRRLATTLNVQAMSLYNHVASKSDLLDGITELVFDQVELPEPEMAWPEQVRAVALSMYRAFSRHLPVAVALITDQANPATRTAT